MKYETVVLGGTGHVGSAVVEALLQQKQSVMIIGHDPEKAAEWQAKGITYEVADVQNWEQLEALFTQGRRLFILNPPAPPSTDTVKEEFKSIHSILTALKGLHLEKIVAASTYGAQKGEDLADLGTLYELEQGLAELPSPFAILRSAYYMSNWLTVFEPIKKDGILPTLYPADFKLPMVAPEDIGAYAANLLLNEISGLYFIEGPEQYSPADVAAAFSKELHKPVKTASTPKAKWLESLKQAGFSDKAAGYMSNMTELTIKQKFKPANAHIGNTTLNEYISSMVKNQ